MVALEMNIYCALNFSAVVVFAPLLRVLVGNVAKRIVQLYRQIPIGNHPSFRPFMNGLEIAACVHATCGRHIGVKAIIPLVRDR